MKQFPKFAAFVALGALLGQVAVAADPPAPAAGAPAPGRTTSVPLTPDAPSSYVVQKGDTLWGISAKFLTQPWYWPEVWYLNPEVQNPHRIYPGDTLRLVYDANGRPQVRVERGEGRVERGDSVRLEPQMRSTPLDQAITPIPFEIVAAFMSKPSVVAAEDAKGLPYIVAFGDRRVVGGAGDVLYVRGLEGSDPGSRFNVVHVGDRLKDPDDGHFLGFLGVYTGSARLDRAAGPGKDDFAKLLLTNSARETLMGDRLVRDRLDVPLDFVPHAPAQDVKGSVIAIVGGTSVIGQYQVVVFNRGKQHGLEPGNVLAVWQQGEKAKDRGPGGAASQNQFTEPFAPNVRLPSERAGTIMVFKAYERMGFGLVMNAENVMHVGDSIRNP
jgi:hypothetical protein